MKTGYVGYRFLTIYFLFYCAALFSWYITHLVAGGFTSEGNCEVSDKRCASSKRGTVPERGQDPASESNGERIIFDWCHM